MCDFQPILVKEQQIALMVSTLAIASALIFMNTIGYLLNKSKLDFVKWDLSNVTLRDFSVELTISPEIWDAWKTHK